MKIAVAYEDGQVFQHFGRTEHFKVYTIEDEKVTMSEVISTNGNGHGALTGFLKNNAVNTLICGGIGSGANQALAQSGINLYGGVTGGADKAVEALLANRLDFNSDIGCNHHGEHHHGDGSSCG